MPSCASIRATALHRRPHSHVRDEGNSPSGVRKTAIEGGMGQPEAPLAVARQRRHEEPRNVLYTGVNEGSRSKEDAHLQHTQPADTSC